MAAFDLDRFRKIAFGRTARPNHPMAEIASAQKLLKLLPDEDPDTAIADLTHWAATLNLAEDFTPGRRSRIFMLLDDAARPVWRQLGQQYLAPAGKPNEGGEGDERILRALFDSATEFASGFETCLEDPTASSRWVAAHRPRLAIRNLRWLIRRLALAHMLRLPLVDAIWEKLHRLYAQAEEADFARTAMPAFE